MGEFDVLLGGCSGVFYGFSVGVAFFGDVSVECDDHADDIAQFIYG